jgi:hypothetical protein
VKRVALELGPMGTKFDMYFADRTVELHILFFIFFYHSPSATFHSKGFTHCSAGWVCGNSAIRCKLPKKDIECGKWKGPERRKGGHSMLTISEDAYCQQDAR